MFDMYLFSILIIILNIINFISYNYLSYKYKLFENENIYDFIFNPYYWIWIGVYLYEKESKNVYVIYIIKIFFMIYDSPA